MKTPVLWTGSEFFGFAKRAHDRPLYRGCSRNPLNRKESHEPYSEINTCHMALSVSHCLGAKVPVPCFGGRPSRGRQSLLTDIQRAKSLRSRRNEYPKGSCTSDHNGAPQSIDIRVDETFKRSHRDTGVAPFQRTTKEAILGKSPLGSWVLRGYRRHGRRNDTALCPVSREA